MFEVLHMMTNGWNEKKSAKNV